MGVVLSSFLGIRKRAQSDRDAGSVKPIHVIAAGVLAAAIFVGILIAAVRLITRSLRPFRDITAISPLLRRPALQH
jgi:Protein of unknown function (DUF2970)